MGSLVHSEKHKNTVRIFLIMIWLWFDNAFPWLVSHCVCLLFSPLCRWAGRDAVMTVCLSVLWLECGCVVAAGGWLRSLRVPSLCRGPVCLSLLCNGSETGERRGGGGEHLLLIALPLSLVDLLQWKSADEITGPAGPSTTIAESEKEKVCVSNAVCLPPRPLNTLSMCHLQLTPPLSPLSRLLSRVPSFMALLLLQTMFD